MTNYDLLQLCWDEGWDAYWEKKQQSECPAYPEQEERDEWMLGWLAAQNASFYEDGSKTV